MRQLFILFSAIVLIPLCFACNDSATGSSSSDTAASKTDSVKPPAVTEGGIRDTTMYGFDSTRSK